MVKRIADSQDSRFILSRGLFLPPWRLQPTPRPFFDRSRFPEKRVFYTRSTFSWFTAANTARNVTQSAIFLYLPSASFASFFFFFCSTLPVSYLFHDQSAGWHGGWVKTYFLEYVRNFIRIRLLLRFFSI